MKKAKREKKSKNGKDKHNNIQLRATNALNRFYKANQDLENLMRSHEDLFAAAREYATARNEALEDAKQAQRDLVLQKKISQNIAGESGEFLTSAIQKKAFDPTPLFEEMPRQSLIDAQAIHVEEVITIREEEVQRLVAKKKLSQDAYKKACKRTPGTPSVRCPYNPIQF